jgi:hypothetical protein
MKKVFYLFIAITVVNFSCTNETTTQATATEERIENYTELIERGREISMSAQMELLKNVSTAMEQGGPTNAIGFCNIHAMPLTDSLSQSHSAKISRISNKNRNAENVLNNELEQQLWQYYQSHWASAKQVDTVVSSQGKTIYYKPISIAMPACLKCHGEPTVDIAENTLALIDSLYPNDKAKHYKLDDFRGLWKIEF